MSKLYEVVELANGDFALQNEDIESEEPLVSMRFSAELKNVLQEAKIDLARVMVEAGLEFVATLAEERTQALNSLGVSDVKGEISEVVELGEEETVILTRKISQNIDIKNDQAKTDKTRSGKMGTRKNKKIDEVLDEDLEDVVSHLVH